MLHTLKVQHGTIVLPPQLGAAWENIELHIRDYPDRIALEAPKTQSRGAAIAQLEQLAGIWKGRAMPDAVAWQRTIRREWDRPLP